MDTPKQNHVHVLSIIALHRPGVLARVAGLFSRRGFNIEYVNAGPTKNPNIYNITIVVEGDDRIIEQIRRQVEKLVDIIKVEDVLTKEAFAAEERIKKKAYLRAIEKKEMMR